MKIVAVKMIGLLDIKPASHSYQTFSTDFLRLCSTTGAILYITHNFLVYNRKENLQDFVFHAT